MTAEQHLANLHNRPFPIQQWAVTVDFVRTVLWAYWHWQKVPDLRRIYATVAPKAHQWWFTPSVPSVSSPSESQTPN
ncbi:MAG: hypothetical protein HC919_15170 [Oscillatoriales cyanobacterium SM2_2_1]|nr:hypothetical protein [Oscillatoriales cyanobacterium SM2_2_1]